MDLRNLVQQCTAGRPRLAFSLVAGIVLYAVLPPGLEVAMRGTIAWDGALITFLALSAAMAVGATPTEMRWRAQSQDTSKWVILGLMVAAALVSLLTIGLVLPDAKQRADLVGKGLIGLAGLTILLSWVFAHTMFALHYAHEFYGDAGSVRPRSGGKASATNAGGLAFPEEQHPDYWDFFYFSFVVGMTCQVSDVQVTSRSMRRLTLAHGLVAFLFNTVILALTINIAAGLL